MTNLRTARHSTRRFNIATDAQRADWKADLRTILIAEGMSEFAALCAAEDGAWDGMDTPSSAAVAILVDWKRRGSPDASLEA